MYNFVIGIPHIALVWGKPVIPHIWGIIGY